MGLRTSPGDITMTTGTWHKTACNLCYVNCGIEVLLHEGHIEKVRGDRSSPKSQGYLCNKAARIPYYAHHKDRLTTPLRRRADGGFDAINWEVAIAEIAERVRNLVDRHGGKSMAHPLGDFGDRHLPVDRIKPAVGATTSEEHTSELRSRLHSVCRHLLQNTN